ncbi:MAG TPA: tripartite tricarboxylate transporter permease, partial [Thermomicrobiales bacterium]|nr:tripartite tricarboxylate transporter permease [Thermomicrobiales bacterium]
MGALGDLANGFGVALTPENLGWALVGVLLGTFVGVLPGIGPALTVALLLPVTYSLEPVSAFIMFAGIYYGAMYGGSTTSILLNTPGESASIITALEGNKMAKRGRGAAALATAAIGSFVAGTLATLALTFVAPVMVDVALKFGEAEYVALIVLAFVAITAMLGVSIVRGLVSLFFGLAIGLVGIDSLTAQSRFTFGVPQLLNGIDVVTVAVGLFAVGETLWVGARLRHDPAEIVPVRGSIWMTREEWRRSWKPWLRGTALGFPIGSLPAGGAEIPTFLSYSIEKQLTKHPEEFGQGAIEGVAGPEAANNASAAGVLVPLLTLGLPTSATAAILLVAFQRYGLNPGPLLFEKDPDLVWGLIASLYIGNAMLLVLNLPLAGLWVRLLAIPRPLLYAGILLFAGLGTYSLHNSTVDLVVLYVLGVVGFLMRRFGIPVAPAVVGVILGPELETHFRRALQISRGDYSTFVTRPMSLTIFVIAALLLIGPMLARMVVPQRR